MPKPINSIVIASEVLKCLCDGTYRIADIVRKRGYNKSTVHKVLKSLEIVGFVTQDKLTRQYFPGPQFQRLTLSPVKIHQALIFQASENMEKLRDVTNETVSLWISQGASRINIHMFESNHIVGHIPKLGDVAPIYSGAAGKVLLSETDDKDLQTLLNKIILNPVISTISASKDSLLKELDKIRNQGYAWSTGETFKGISAIAVRIKYSACPVALLVAGPEVRMKEMETFLIDKIIECSASISSKL